MFNKAFGEYQSTISRYSDDIILIQTDTQVKLKFILGMTYQIHFIIKVQMKLSCNSKVNLFLDALVYLNKPNILIAKQCQKLCMKRQ